VTKRSSFAISVGFEVRLICDLIAFAVSVEIPYEPPEVEKDDQIRLGDAANYVR
jgi:hypothetical protein